MLFQNPHFKPELCGEDNDSGLTREQAAPALERRTMGSTDHFEKNTFNPAAYQPRSTLNGTSVRNLINRYEDLKKASSYLGYKDLNDPEPIENEGRVKQIVSRIEDKMMNNRLVSALKTTPKRKSPDLSRKYEENFFDDMSVLDSSLNNSVNTMNEFEWKKDYFDNPLGGINKSEVSLRDAAKLGTSQKGLKNEDFKTIETEDFLSDTDNSHSLLQTNVSGVLKFDRNMFDIDSSFKRHNNLYADNENIISKSTADHLNKQENLIKNDFSKLNSPEAQPENGNTTGRFIDSSISIAGHGYSDKKLTAYSVDSTKNEKESKPFKKSNNEADTQKFEFKNTVFIDPATLPPSESSDRLSYKYLERVTVNPRVAEIIEKYKKKPENQADKGTVQMDAGPIKIAIVKGDSKSNSSLKNDLLRSASSNEGEKKEKSDKGEKASKFSQETDKLDSNFKGSLKNSGSCDDRVTFGVNLAPNSGNTSATSAKKYDFLTLLENMEFNQKNEKAKKVENPFVDKAFGQLEDPKFTNFLKKSESIPYERSLPEELVKEEKGKEVEPSVNKDNYDKQEKEVFEEMNSLKEKVISMLLKYQNIINKNKPQEVLQKEIDKDCELVSKEYSTIVDKYVQVNESFISATKSSHMSMIKPSSQKEQEINNMMDLVQDFLNRFDAQKSVNVSGRKLSTNNSDISHFNLDKKYKQAKKLLEKSFDSVSNSDISQNERIKYFKMQELKRRTKNEEFQKSFISASKVLEFSEISTITAESQESIKSLKYRPHTTGKTLFYNVDQNNSNLEVFGFRFKKIRPYRFYHERQISTESFSQIDIYCPGCETFITPLTEYSHKQICRGHHGGKGNSCDKKKIGSYLKKLFHAMEVVIGLIQSKQYIIVNTQRRSQINELISSLKKINVLEAETLHNEKGKNLKILNDKREQLKSILTTINDYDKYTLLFAISLKRLDKILEELANLLEGKLKQDEAFFFPPLEISHSNIVLEDILSDFEENDAQDDEVLKRDIQLKEKEMERLDILKQKSELEKYNEKAKRYFYTEAVNQKMKLPDNHPNRKVLISELYDDCVKLNVPIEKWRAFLQDKIQV